MDGKIEQHVCIKCCLTLAKSATEALEMLLEALGEHSLSRTAVFEWQSHFKAGRVSVEGDKRSGQPSTSKTTDNVEKIRELSHNDHHRTIHELADTIGISLPGDLNRKFEHVLHCPFITTMHPPTCT
jgi:hypothetical protein